MYCERPSQDERTRMAQADSQVQLKPEQRFDPGVPVPPGSSFELARKLVAMADQKMYEAKRTFAGSPDPHIVQVNVRIVGGRLVEI